MVIVAAVWAVNMIVVMIVVMVVIVRGEQRAADLVLDAGGLIARRIGILDGHGHDLGGKLHVVGATEVVTAQATGAVEQQ